MKVYITKFVFTQGIFEREVEVCDGDRMVKVIKKGIGEYYHKNDWHETREKAILCAEDLRRKKIQALEKQIEKLKKLKF